MALRWETSEYIRNTRNGQYRGDYTTLGQLVKLTIPVKKSVCKHRFPTKTQHIANKNDNVLQNYKIN